MPITESNARSGPFAADAQTAGRGVPDRFIRWEKALEVASRAARGLCQLFRQTARERGLQCTN